MFLTPATTTVSRSRALAGIAAAAAIPIAARAQATGKPYTFGGLFPMTGAAAEIGLEQSHGMELAVEQVNARGGVGGWKLQAIPIDHKGNTVVGVQAMNQLVNLDKVPFVLMGFAGVILATYPIAVQNQILLLNIGGISSSLLDKPWLYNNQEFGAGLNEPLAQYLVERGVRTAGVLVSEDPNGKDNSTAFIAEFIKLGGKIVANETFPVSTTDFSSQLAKINATNPQAMYLIVVGDSQGLLVKQARASGFKGLLTGLPYPTLSQIAGPAADGYIGTAPAVDWTSKSRDVQAFYQGYKAKFGQAPTWVAGHVYEGTMLLAKLIDTVSRSGKDPRNGAELKAALDANPRFPNCLSGGQVVFGKDHGCRRAIGIEELHAGKWTTVRVITPAS